ncbi:MAG: histidine triad nucleotide-binding protein [Deltaproteobacteria bacterium]|nr:histidine triad nucleotide-binding protein [Deltaproteobacteria bacterium]MBW2563299.1 histidine triad nucleotide-binding protein [Deltaproteobacteria bacterium]
MQKDCIFCKIVNREIPTEFLYEDDDLVVFKDINPHAPVHILIVPKKHIRSINDLTENDREIISHMIMVGKDIAQKESINSSGYKLLFNVERGGGQVIFHLHLHLIGGWEKK